jgi:short-subunit dehydrogenase
VSGALPWRTALVTGASSGIGRGLAEQLAVHGVHVVLAARRKELLEEVAAGITRAGGAARIERLDVSDTEATVAAVRAIDAEMGGLDLVVANAGAGAPQAADGGTVSFEWENLAAAFHVNFCGAAATLTAVLPRMVERGRGHLVGIGSLASFGALPDAAAYCAPKAGLAMLLECLRLDLRGTGVHATTVHVGFVRTAMTEKSAFDMPQLMDVEPAVRVILERLPGAPATIEFPQPLALAARLGGRLPRAARELIFPRRRR